ncbi:MAG TPA: EamA family transporter RarD [Steroidobacteraceae bacterium]|jgi:chloramphenicol-sensitive protein RarD|nr:EamA family transporter RarD [Steroidobacteraceae bacterium]
MATGSSEASAGRGFGAAISAFGIWGLFPIYLIGLRHISAMEITAHRIVWSCVFVLAWLALAGDLRKLGDAAKRRGVLVRLVWSAFFIAVNWVGFAWAVNNGHVLEVSLAYFIGPLLNILLGIFVLRERLNGTQWLAVAFAAAGVLYLTFIAGHPPWIALMVGSSFAFYGLIRKTVNIDALPGLAVETILLTPFAAVYLVWCEMQGTAALGHDTALVTTLLLAGGVVTSVPLVLFAFGARQVPYSTIGVLQFIAPTLQLVCGLVVFGETLAPARAMGFALIWVGLLIYIANALWQARGRTVVSTVS